MGRANVHPLYVRWPRARKIAAALSARSQSADPGPPRGGMVNLGCGQADGRRLLQEIQPDTPKGGEECIPSTKRFAVLTANSAGANISHGADRAMTDEQKFFFDLQGWLLLPAVLSPGECEAVRKHLYGGGNGYTGPAQELLDHPALVDVLSEILGAGPPAEDYYNFRCENSFVTLRKAGWKPGSTEVPHGGAGIGAISYRSDGKGIYSGLTRVVWELHPVEKGDGGTLFLSSTHKASFPQPPCVREPDNAHMESYS